MRPRFRRPALIAFALCLAAAITFVLVWQAAPRYAFGLTAEYRETADQPGTVRADPRVDTASLRAWIGDGPARWVFWTGWIHLPGADVGEIELSAAGFAEIYIDGRTLARAQAGERVRRALPAGGGSHEVRVFYRHDGAEPAIDVRWVRTSGESEPIPDHAFSPHRILPGMRWLRAHAGAVGTGLAIGWTLLVVALLVLLVGARTVRALELHEILQDRWLRRALAFALLVGGYPLWWGLGVGGYWAMDELSPPSILHGLQTWYMDGWHDKYPPLHFYINNVLFLPFFAARDLGYISLVDPPGYPAQVLLGRVLVLAMALATVVVVFTCSAAAFGRRAALLSCIVWTATLPFAYHMKLSTVDVPYTFWFALSLLGYMRIVQRGAWRDYVTFTVAAVCAVCTKDQAYGLYALPVLHATWLRVRRRHAAGASWPSALVDSVLLGALVLGAAMFAAIHNMPFNWQGFVSHVQLITGSASQAYRVYDNTLSGQLALLGSVILQFGWCMSWPSVLAAAIGVTLPRREGEWTSSWLLFPAISYYLTFLAVIGYCYDRFLLPMCLLAACFAGRAFARALDRASGRWMSGAVAAVLIFAAWRAASVSMLMAGDTRYAATLWLREQVPAHASIGGAAPYEYLPSLPGEHIIRMPLDSTTGAVDADYIAVNVRFADRYEAGTVQAEWFARLADGSAGYDLVYRAHHRIPLAIVGYEAPYAQDAWYTTIPKLNPEIRIYKRR